MWKLHGHTWKHPLALCGDKLAFHRGKDAQYIRFYCLHFVLNIKEARLTRAQRVWANMDARLDGASARFDLTDDGCEDCPNRASWTHLLPDHRTHTTNILSTQVVWGCLSTWAQIFRVIKISQITVGHISDGESLLVSHKEKRTDGNLTFQDLNFQVFTHLFLKLWKTISWHLKENKESFCSFEVY